jgi:TP901 family phage tail tape measure protein
MSVRTDTINLQVNINGDKSRAELNNLKKTAADLTLELAGMKKGTAEYIAKNSELAKVKQDMTDLKQKIGLTALTQKELNQELSKLKSLRGSVIPFSKEYDDLSKSIKAVEKRIYEVKTGTQGFAAQISSLTDNVKQFSILALGGWGLEIVFNMIRSILSIITGVSGQLADIMRVTGMTKNEVLDLDKALARIDTNTSVKGLREIAIVAGKLGVAKEDILGFVKATDMLVVALGDELGDADQITTQLGKIIGVFDKTDGKVTGDKLTAIGNAIVDLANKGVASGGFIVDFTQRLAGLASTANIGLGETIGLAAGLEEMGQRAESSSTAIIKVMGDMGKDVPKFAKVAGMSIEAFSDLLRTKPSEALIKVSEGLVKGKNSFEDISKSFDVAGEDGARIITVLGAIGGKADFFRTKIGDASAALKENTEITQAFELKSQTLGSTIDKIGKEFVKLVSGGAVMSFFKGIADVVLTVVRALGQLPDTISKNSFAFSLLALGIATLNRQLIISAALTIKDTLVKIYNAAATRLSAIATNISIASQSAYITVTSLLTGRITLATAAQRLWSIAVSTGLGPIGLLISAVGILALAFNKQSAASKLVTDIQNKVSDATTDQISKIGTLTSVIQDGNASYDNKKKALQELINLNPNYLSGLTLENMKTSEGKKILDGYINSLYQKAELEAKQSVLIEKLKSRNNSFNELRNVDKVPELKNVSDEDLTRMILKPNSKEFALMAQARSWAKVDIDQLETDIKQIKTLQTDVANVAKKNFDAFSTTSGDSKRSAEGIIAQLQGKIKNLEDALPTLTTKTAIHANREELKKAQAELNALLENSAQSTLDHARETYRKQFDDLMSKLSVDIAKNTLHPLEAAFVKINEETVKQVKLIQDGLAKKYITPAEAKKAMELVHQESVSASNEVYEKYKREMSKKMKDGQNAFEIEMKPHFVVSRVDPNDGSTNFFKTIFDEKAMKKSMDELMPKLPNLTQRLFDFFRRDQKAKLELDIMTSPEGSKKWLDSTMKMLSLQERAELENTELTEAEKQVVREKYNELRTNAENAALDKEADKWRDRISMAQSFSNILSNIENAKLNKFLRAGELEKKALQKQLNGKLLSQEQYNLKVAQIDEEADRRKRALQREQAKRERALNLMLATVNGYVAISKAATALPWPFNIPGIIAETLRSGLMIAGILSTPLPELGKGDWVRDGDKHSARSGGINAKIERDEAVINAGSMTDDTVYEVKGTTAQITSALNSKKGGTSWAGGAMIRQVEWLNTRPAAINPNMPRIMEQGGIVRSMNQAQPQNAAASQDNAELVAEVKALREDLGKWQTKIQVIMSIKEYREAEAIYDAASKASGFKQS